MEDDLHSVNPISILIPKAFPSKHLPRKRKTSHLASPFEGFRDLYIINILSGLKWNIYNARTPDKYLTLKHETTFLLALTAVKPLFFLSWKPITS